MRASRQRLWLAMGVLVAASCQQPFEFYCGGCLEKIEEFPLVPYEVVNPCLYRYYGEPDAPGFPHPEVNGLAYPSFTVDTSTRLITFTRCDPDAGIAGKVELRYVENNGEITFQ